MMWLLLIFALLFTCSASQFVFDRQACKKDSVMECFVLGECNVGVQDPEEKPKISEFNGRSDLSNPKCPVIVERRKLNADKTLYYIQIINETLPKDKIIEIYQGDQAILSCDEVNGNVTVKKHALIPDKFNDLQIALYEDHSRVEGDTIVCAFTAEKMNSIRTHSAVKSGGVVSIHFGLKIYEAVESFKIWQGEKVRCDPDMIQDPPATDSLRKTVRHKADMKLNCNSYNQGSSIPHHLYVTENDMTTKVAKLECKEKGTEWIYTYNNGSGDVFLEESITAYCAPEASQTCEQPSCTASTGCPKYTPGKDDKSALLECDGGKWKIGGKYYEQTVKTECKLDSETNSAQFFITLPGSEEKAYKGEGECFTKYNCKEYGQFLITPCERDIETNKAINCTEVVQTEDSLSCKEEGFSLLVADEKNNTMYDEKFECDPLKGRYWNAVLKEGIEPRAQITCKKRGIDLVNNGATDAQIAGYSAGAAIVAIVLVVGTALLIFCLVARRHRLKGTVLNKREVWRRMPPAKKLAEALAVFEMATQARLDQDLGILDGLKLLDTILACETEDPVIWEAVDGFLRRLQTVAFDKAYPLEKTLNRYCYLQARKIIDKHGWTSPTPITNANWSGYIRVCAIRLLHLARRDDIEAQAMVLEGWRVLQFDAVNQYPHCGLLWALLTQQRAGADIRLHHDLVRRLIRLYNLMFSENGKPPRLPDVPEANRFPQFGSVRHQIAFALGAGDVGGEQPLTGLKAGMSDVLEAKSILEGALYALSGNTNCHITIMSHRLLPLVDRSPSLAEKMLTTMVFQQRARVAKKFWEDKDEWEKEERTRINNAAAHGNFNPERDSGEIARTAAVEYMKNEKTKYVKHSDAKGFVDKAHSTYHSFVDCLESEKKSIVEWLIEKVGKEEAEKGQLKNDPRLQSGSDATPKSGSNSSSSQVKSSSSLSNPVNQANEGAKGGAKGELSNIEFIDKFASACHKEWTVQRAKCTLTEAEQTKLRGILARIFDPKVLLGECVKFRFVEVTDVLEKAIAVFKTEPLFMEDVPAGVTVVGDIHGQLNDMARMFEAHAKEGKPGYETQKYVFLGDYVDRGSHILEVIMALYILKILYPDRFFLLRGNHEFVPQNMKAFTLHDMEHRFGTVEAEYLFYKMHECFCYMPICAVVGGEIFCAHGGISASSMTRHELRQLRNPVFDDRMDSLVADILWSDPRKGLQGFLPNIVRHCGIFFGMDYLEGTLERMDCTTIIRAHTIPEDGYELHSPSCLNVFNSTNNHDTKPNKAAFVQIGEDLRSTIVVMDIDKIREKAEIDIHGAKVEDEISKREREAEAAFEE